MVVEQPEPGPRGQLDSDRVFPDSGRSVEEDELHLRVELDPLRCREPGDLFLMPLEHDHQLAEEVLVVVEPHLPEPGLIQYRCERRATQRAAGNHALPSNRSTMSSPRGV